MGVTATSTPPPPEQRRRDEGDPEGFSAPPQKIANVVWFDCDTVLGVMVDWIEDDSNIRFVPFRCDVAKPGEAHGHDGPCTGQIGYYKVDPGVYGASLITPAVLKEQARLNALDSQIIEARGHSPARTFVGRAPWWAVLWRLWWRIFR